MVFLRNITKIFKTGVSYHETQKKGFSSNVIRGYAYVEISSRFYTHGMLFPKSSFAQLSITSSISHIELYLGLDDTLEI